MPSYRIHRIKDGPKESFRWAAHTGGLAVVKPKDYELAEERDASNPYELWQAMRSSEAPLRPGDVLETVLSAPDASSGQLLIAKYVGFEPAQWFIPEVKPLAPPAAIESMSQVG